MKKSNSNREAFKRFEELSKLFPEETDLVALEEIVSETREKIIERIPKPRKALTRILDRKDEAVRYTFDLVRSSVEGKLNEITIRSPSQNFSTLIIADGVKKLSRTYSELLQISPHSQLIDAYEEAENGVYILHIKEMYWRERFLATLYVDQGSITFNNIWAVWEEKV